MALTPLGSVDLPPFRASAFDHGDVHLASGRIFEAGAHTTAFDRARQLLAVFLPGSCRVALYRETEA